MSTDPTWRQTVATVALVVNVVDALFVILSVYPQFNDSAAFASMTAWLSTAFAYAYCRYPVPEPERIPPNN